jgi:hypothetical protein
MVRLLLNAIYLSIKYLFLKHRSFVRIYITCKEKYHKITCNKSMRFEKSYIELKRNTSINILVHIIFRNDS